MAWSPGGVILADTVSRRAFPVVLQVPLHTISARPVILRTMMKSRRATLFPAIKTVKLPTDLCERLQQYGEANDCLSFSDTVRRLVTIGLDAELKARESA